MSRFFASAALSLGVGLGLIFGPAAGCSTSSLDTVKQQDGGLSRLDSGPVDPSEGGELVDARAGVVPNCERYCGLVTAHCTGDNAQYSSKAECLAFCRLLPPAQPEREVEEKHAPSVACRQYWADSPAQTDPHRYCLAAGPFGGNVCGDRCTAFCTVVLAACSPNGQLAPYASQPECASACAGFSYRDVKNDGGGEGPSGPDGGDTLNCRLYQLRRAAESPLNCALLRPDGGACGND